MVDSERLRTSEPPNSNKKGMGASGGRWTCLGRWRGGEGGATRSLLGHFLQPASWAEEGSQGVNMDGFSLKGRTLTTKKVGEE